MFALYIKKFAGRANIYFKFLTQKLQKKSKKIIGNFPPPLKILILVFLD